MNKKRLILLIKIVLLLAVVGFLAYKLNNAWHDVQTKNLAIAWRFAPLGLLGFAGSMITSGLVWQWLARKMDHIDSLPNSAPTSPAPHNLLPLLGAYTFSQMGKYVPGKVVLLLMRVERAGRFGMSAATCTLATLLENALYMVSGGLVGMLAILRITQGLDPHQRALVWPVTIAGVLVLAAACHPAVFYTLVNRLLRTMKKPAVPPERRLTAATLAMAVVFFVPCWLCGGIALWASARCLYDLPIQGAQWFAGAYALSVIIGMASPMPGGLGIREAVLGVAVTYQLAPLVGSDKAALLAAAAVVLQRLFQIIVEVLLGLAGGLLTSLKPTTPIVPAAKIKNAEP